MLTSEQVCYQLSLLYPDFGQCGDNLNVNWDERNKAWAVDFEYKGDKIRHFLESEDATTCVVEERCLGMAFEFGQFR